MRYFPLRNDRFVHDFGVRAIASGDPVLERTAEYEEQVALKRSLLHADLANYYQALPGSLAACDEAASLLASMASASPGGLDTTRGIDAVTMDEEDRFLQVAQSIQEDVIVLKGDAEAGHPIIGGVVCFPSGWTIAEKIGQSMWATHAPVPEYQSVLSPSTDRLLEKLKPGRPVWRTNWGVRGSGRLDQSPKHADQLAQELAALSAENIGDRCHFRVERQTLSRLSASGGILFTIHTHQVPLDSLSLAEKRTLASVLRTCPEATLEYKGIAPMRGLLLNYLGT